LLVWITSDFVGPKNELIVFGMEVIFGDPLAPEVSPVRDGVQHSAAIYCATCQKICSGWLKTAQSSQKR
jgi:hypothetical protein